MPFQSPTSSGRGAPMPTTEIQHYYQNIDGFFWFEHAYRRLLLTLLDDLPSHFVEVGSYKGRSAAFLGVEIFNAGLECTLHCVDSWERPNAEDGPPVRVAFDQNTEPLALALGKRFRVHPMRSIEAAQLFANDSLDVVFIDGDHEYASVKADIAAWYPKVKRGGWIGGDDWMMKPVSRAVIEYFGEHYILCHGWATLPEPMPWPSWLVMKT